MTRRGGACLDIGGPRSVIPESDVGIGLYQGIPAWWTHLPYNPQALPETCLSPGCGVGSKLGLLVVDMELDLGLSLL